MSRTRRNPSVWVVSTPCPGVNRRYFAANPPPIVVGAGLHVRAAIDGLDSSIPAENEDLRNAQEDARLHGTNTFIASSRRSTRIRR